MSAQGFSRLSRRDALLALTAATLGCRSGSHGSAQGAPSAGPWREPWGGLEIAHVTDMREDERGGRAWWHLEASDRPRYVLDEPGPPMVSTLPNFELEVARSAVQGVLRTTRERYAPKALFLAGFSQGAMLSIDL